MRQLLFRLAFLTLALAFTAAPTLAADRPNIVWITCEDTNPHLVCSSDTFAVTPQLDAFARKSVRCTHAFAYTGACSPSRSCLISGVYPLRLGTPQMRSTIPLPPLIKGFPAYLCAAGYYASNNEKEDYNFKPSRDVCLGIDHKHLTFRFQGRDYRLTEVHGEVVREILT